MSVLLDEAQLRTELEALLTQDATVRRVAFESSVPWSGPEVVSAAGQTFKVRDVRSVLALREALAQEDGGLVLVTDLDERSIGWEAAARLYRQRIRRLRSWDALAVRLALRHIDPLLQQDASIAPYVLEAFAAAGWPPVPNGTLTLEGAWEVLFPRLGMHSPPQDSAELLAWTAQGDLDRFMAAPVALQSAATRRVIGLCGEESGAILQCVRQGQGREALPVGLSCLVIFQEPRSPELLQAAARLERWVGDRSLSEATAQRWGRAAEEAVTRLVRRDSSLARRQMEAADNILRTVRAESEAWRSTWSPLGREQRIDRFANALANWAPPGELEALAQQLSPEDQERAEMAVRLVRWLRCKPTAPATFPEAALQYVHSSAWVDRARSRLALSEGSASLVAASAKLLDEVTTRREAENKRFAELLLPYNETSSGTREVLFIEHVMTQVVTPLVKAGRGVLLVVMDGMSQAVAGELLEDLQKRDWLPVSPDGSPLPPVLTAFPSVTEVCRSSLLAGKLLRGTSAAEVQAFRAPLFHKPALAEGESLHLGREVVDAILDEDNKLVGVVVNAVDDTLAKDEQLQHRWRIDTIRPLEALFETARRAGRVVVLASDHGHVLERGSELKGRGAAARWAAGDQAGPGEVVMRGPRLLLGDGAPVVMPATEKLRYATKRCGYHGGVTPQEVLAPLVVLALPDRLPKGWQSTVLPPPDWWDPTVSRMKPSGPPPVKADKPQLQLSFEEDGGWVDQLPGARSHSVRTLLLSLDANQGRAHVAHLGQALGLTVAQVRSLIAEASRNLSPDGFPVLSMDFDGDTVVLNKPALANDATVSVTTPLGDRVAFPVPPEITTAERTALALLARFGSLTERRLADCLEKRSVAGFMEVLHHKLVAAGYEYLTMHLGDAEGTIYSFHRDKIS
ncbi:MAG: BREX-2 system phosphatase PglZ [Candidatus Xenobia bacterium]